MSFLAENWRKIIFDPRRPGRVVRRHFEVCVFTYLAGELRTGDIAVIGSESYANFMEQLLSGEECEPLIAAYCQEAGLPAGGNAAVAALRTLLEEAATWVDPGYPDNADLMISAGRPVLKGAGARNGGSRRWSWRRRSTIGCLSGAFWRS